MSDDWLRVRGRRGTWTLAHLYLTGRPACGFGSALTVAELRRRRPYCEPAPPSWRRCKRCLEIAGA